MKLKELEIYKNNGELIRYYKNVDVIYNPEFNIGRVLNGEDIAIRTFSDNPVEINNDYIDIDGGLVFSRDKEKYEFGYWRLYFE